MNKIILTGIISSQQPKKIFERNDGTQGFIGLFSIKLMKQNYEIVDLKTFNEEVGNKIQFGNFVCVEGSLKSRNYRDKWYSDIVIYDLTVLTEGKKEEQKFQQVSESKSEVPGNNQPSSSYVALMKKLNNSPEPREPIEDSEIDV